jgi:mono/diheme cytochrome c family protein
MPRILYAIPTAPRCRGAVVAAHGPTISGYPLLKPRPAMVPVTTEPDRRRTTMNFVPPYPPPLQSRALRQATGLLAVCLAALASPSATAENFERGKELYDHHCQSCHEDLMHAENRRLKSLAELRKRVEAWAAHTGNDWRKDEVDDVLYYLNKRFYKFEQKAL